MTNITAIHHEHIDLLNLRLASIQPRRIDSAMQSSIQWAISEIEMLTRIARAAEACMRDLYQYPDTEWSPEALALHRAISSWRTA